MDFICSFVEFDVQNELYWSIIELRLTEDIEVIGCNDLIVILMIFDRLKLGSEDFRSLLIECIQEKLEEGSNKYVEEGVLYFKDNKAVMDVLALYEPYDSQIPAEILEEREEHYINYHRIRHKLFDDNETLLELSRRSKLNELILTK